MSPSPLKQKRTTRARRNVSASFVLAMSFLLNCLTALHSAQAQGRYQTIVQTGDSANGNGTFSYFSTMSLNNSGQVVFQPLWIENTNSGGADDTGIFFHDGTSLVEIAREGDSAAGNGEFGSPSSGQLNHNGHIAFQSSMTNTNNNTSDDNGIFFHNGLGMIEVAREGDSAAGNGNLGSFSKLRLNDVGQMAFRSRNMSETNNNTQDDEGIFLHNGSSLIQIAREGDSAVGNGELGHFDALHLNNRGQVAFLSYGMTNTSNPSAVFTHNGSILNEIARIGDSAVGNGELGGLTVHGFNDSGQVAFSSFNMTNTSNGLENDRAIFLSGGAGLIEVAREGNSAAGNGSLGDFQSVQLNNSGQIAFNSIFINGSNLGSADDSGVFLYDGSTLSELAREGDSAAGNGKLGKFFQKLQLNNGGQVAFYSQAMTNTDHGAADDAAVFITDGIDLIEVRRKGDTVNGNALTQTADIQLNDFGQIAMHQLFASGELIETWTPQLHWRASTDGSWDDKSNWTLSLNPGDPHDVFIDPVGSLTVTGPGSDASVRFLQIGGNTGQATLNLAGGSTINTMFGAYVAPNGTLTGDGTVFGTLTNDGTIVASNLTTDSFTNSAGVVRGNGILRATNSFSNHSDIRVASGQQMQIISPNFSNANTGSVQITGGELEITNQFGGNTSSNSGIIEVLGGTLRVDGQLTNNANTGLVTGRDAVMRFNGGLTNNGSLGVSFGTSDIFGDIQNNATGTIMVSGGANATFYDDIEQNGTMVVASVGSTSSTAVLFGDFTGAGGFTGGGDVFFFGDLRIGNSPAEVLFDGNAYLGPGTDSLFELAGRGPGEFDSLFVTGDLGVDGNLSVALLDGFQLKYNDEFLIADVDGNLIGQFNGLGDGDLVGNYGGIDLFITYGAGDGNDVALFSAVPEPGGPGAVALACVCCTLVRRPRRGIRKSSRPSHRNYAAC